MGNVPVCQKHLARNPPTNLGWCMNTMSSARVRAKLFRSFFCVTLLFFLAACSTSPQPSNSEPDTLLESSAVWTKIADERTSFTVSGTQVVRYGIDSRWVEKTLTDEGYCGNAFFGRDPAKGIVKRCEVRAFGSAAPTPTTGETVTVSYQKDNSNFTNPERGFTYPHVVYSDNPKALDAGRVNQAKDQGMTIIHLRYGMVTFKNSSISQSYLERIQSDLDMVRNSGLKTVIRFAYTFNESGKHADAPMSRMLEHVEQLKPILQRNADVITYLEAGFIGRWGEWNKSSNGLGDETNPQNTGAQSRLINALLSAVPEERMVTIRYLGRKKAIVSGTPLSSSQAYTGSAQARTGHMNDYFTIDNWSGSDRTYLSQDTLFTVQGGEPIKLNGSRSECPAALDELATFHWSTMNIPGDAFSNLWRDGGCYETIAKRLGYRFALSKATLPKTVQPDTTLSVGLELSNEGFAGLYNPRGIELVLRNRDTGQESRLEVDTSEDIRLFLPGPGESKNLTLNASVPGELGAGEYDLFLNLPDSSSRLKDNASYSVRLANTDAWESDTGYNRLGRVAIN